MGSGERLRRRATRARLSRLSCVTVIAWGSACAPSREPAPAPGAPEPAASSARPAGPWWTLADAPVPLDPVALAPTGGSRVETARDPRLGVVLRAAKDQPVTLESPAWRAEAREVRALVRFRPKAGSTTTASFAFARRAAEGEDAAPPYAGLQLTLGASRSPSLVSASVTENDGPLFDPKVFEKLDWPFTPSTTLDYRLRAVEAFEPGWPEAFRSALEADMASLPALDDKWLAVRAELRRGAVSVWLDDRLVAQKRDAGLDPTGTVHVTLEPGAELAGITTRALSTGRCARQRGYRALGLGGHVNARGLLAGVDVAPGALPPPGEEACVGGVPFVFPGPDLDGNDHIDVGKSTLRQGNYEGYSSASGGPMSRWVGASERDPTRIQLRFANGSFSALHLVAASDGGDDSVPIVTAAFYRPGAGFTRSFVGRAPLATTTAGVDALPVRLRDGRAIALHHLTIPLDPGLLSSFGDLDVVELELTKETRLYRNYPDPIAYGAHQAGLPSSVHVYAATLEETPVTFDWRPSRFGHVWQSPEEPSYVARVANRTATTQIGKLTVTTTSYDGTESTTHERAVSLPPGSLDPAGASSPVEIPLELPVKRFGYHDVKATLAIAGRTWTESRSLVKLAPDTRSPRWTPGRGALFGYWSYGSGHGSPKPEHSVRLMTMAGARTAMSYPPGLSPEGARIAEAHWDRVGTNAFIVAAQPWPAARRPALGKAALKEWREWDAAIPPRHRPDHVTLFPEPSLSARMTIAHPPEYWGEKPLTPTAEEREQISTLVQTAKLAAATARVGRQGAKVLVPWGDPGFVWPLLRAGLSKDVVDGSGLDVPGFERIPERQLHEQSLHRLYWVRREYAKAGIPEPDLRFVEGIFVPTEPGAVSWREQMDIYHRWSLLSMAYGVKRFYSGWYDIDSSDSYGAEHYGGCGIRTKIPYAAPKPAYAAFATMTDRLNEANFDGWVSTGSTSTFALRFARADSRGWVYALWTLRGTRPATLTMSADGAVEVTDSMNNTRGARSEDRRVTVATGPSVTYVTTASPSLSVASIAVGPPDHSDARPAEGARLVADLGDASWAFTGERDFTLEGNHVAIMHYPGRFTARRTQDAQRGAMLTSKLERPATPHELMPWYGVLRPKRPIVLPGAPSKLGLWVNASSDWGRVIYVLRDAKGERWESIGAKDAYNADDPHSWSQFAFDGTRYLTVELPGHTGWDTYRKNGTTWWRSDEGDGVVDLPLSVEAVVVEQRTHVLYVNDIAPAASNEVSLGRLFAEYDSASDATEEAVRVSRLRAPAPVRSGPLPNPIAELERDGQGAAPTITAVRPATSDYDGTRAHIDFQRARGKTRYELWVGAHADGQAALNLTPEGLVPGQLVPGLRAGVPLYYWLVAVDGRGRRTKPSKPVRHVLVDRFVAK
ncbi:MAG TPA: hypothetical protein PK141_02400 [Polyangiaceae bacterium]|nr:hypothetical protein [Polyangiaceae bacterium]